MKEEDCKVGLPSSIGDEFMTDGVDLKNPSPEQSTSLLLPTVQIVGGVSRLLQLLTSPRLSPQVLQTYDSYYNSCLGALPLRHQLHAQDYLDPVELPPIMYLQNARLALHRQNLTPLCALDIRSLALDKCAAISRDTAMFLRRSMREPPTGLASPISVESDGWEKRMVSAASAFFCTHIWRCTLFLCHRLDFASALVCIKASSTMGNVRPVNIACGKYLEFFVKEITAKWSEHVRFDEDEELLAQVSGDLQGSFENAWVWREYKTDERLGSRSGTEAPLPGHDRLENGGDESGRQRPEQEWDGWGHIVHMLERCQREMQKTPPRPLSAQTSSVPERRDSGTSSHSPAPGNRMSIRDLI